MTNKLPHELDIEIQNQHEALLGCWIILTHLAKSETLCREEKLALQQAASLARGIAKNWIENRTAAHKLRST